jgi:hypothetical protein
MMKKKTLAWHLAATWVKGFGKILPGEQGYNGIHLTTRFSRRNNYVILQ